MLTNQQSPAIINDGTEMMNVSSAPYAQSQSPRSNPSGTVNKKLTICGLIVAVIALLVALIVAATIIPKLDNNNNTISDADADSAKGGNKKTTTTTPAPILITTTNLPDDGTTTTTATTTAATTATTAATTTSSTTTETAATTTATSTATTEAPIDANETTIYYPYTCNCNTSTYGLINAGETYEVGGYYGWFYNIGFKDYYPFADLHISVGDKILFRSTQFDTPDNVWLVSEDVYNSCNFSDLSSSFQLATPVELQCTQDPVGCGYQFLLQDWHITARGKILYFVSTADYSLYDPIYDLACKMGVKLRVFVEDRDYVPIIEGDVTDFDFANTETVKDLEAAIGHLGRMLILSQFAIEQRVRSEGNSGITNVRGHYDGDAPYDDGTYTNGGVASIHDHSDNILIVGIGEIQAVLNGVEFTTRHNDYNLNMPSQTSSNYGATEAIPYPDVPPEVLNAGSINNEILEMQEWFRAFKYQNKTHRNYSLYFRPILCYLEGTWILDDSTLTEPFDSDRHSLDASSWKELHDKIRWMANSGRKNSLENLAHLPSSIRNLYNNTYPIISNWEYRILCHPLKNDIPTSRFKISDDLSVQLMGSIKTRDELYYDRRTRFDLNRYIDVNNPENTDHQWSLGRKTWNYMDYLMEQIPGKDNYIANITDELPDGTEQVIHYNIGNKIINAGYYSRFYGLSGADAMGTTKHRRGWADRYLFAAKTRQMKVSPIEFNYISSDNNIYKTISRWSYSIPFEIIYLTPLTKWNPYNITFYQRDQFDYNNIGLCQISPFNGWTYDRAYFTPSSFFDGITSSSNADTASDNVCSIDSNGTIQNVYPSGHWITFPPIANNVGLVRQRYPIFPIHEEHNTAYKEVKAFEDIILSQDYDNPETNPNGFFGNNRDLIYGFELNLQGGGHQHIVYIPGWQISYFWFNKTTNTYKNTINDIVYVEADERNSHSHTVTIWRDININDNKTWIYHIKQCGFGSWTDNNPLNDNKCADNHDTLTR